MGKLIAGMIGEHIGRTRLPAALDIMCGLHGLALEFELIDTAGREAFDFDACVDDLRARGWTGVTVTHPWKTRAADYAGAGMREGLESLGASNLLRFEDQGVAGYNTDFTGFRGAWGAHMGDAAPGRVAMAGAGGVARALGPALSTLGAAEIAVWDGRPEAARDLAARIGKTARAVPMEDAAEATAAADGLVNATPLGMREYPGSAFDAARIGPQAWAFDAVYTPTQTRFLRDAAAAGVRTISGFALFQHMAMDTFAAYTGIGVDPAAVLPQLDALKPD